MWSTAIPVASLFAFMASSCFAASPQSIARRDFFESQNGRIAVFPNARGRAQVLETIKFLYFPLNGEYELPVKYPALWFQANHVPKSNANDNQKYPATFLAVQIITDNDPRSIGYDDVYLYRNAKWIREADSKFSGKNEWNSKLTSSVSDFFKLQTDPSTLDNFDKKFGKWHAQVDEGEDSSWESRRDWVLSNLSPGVNTRLNGFLYRFVPNTEIHTANPLIFYITVSNVSRMRIRTFAPTLRESPTLYDNDITLVLKRD